MSPRRRRNNCLDHISQTARTVRDVAGAVVAVSKAMPSRKTYKKTYKKKAYKSKRSYGKKKAKTTAAKVKKISKKVHQLAKIANAGIGHHVHRNLDSVLVKCEVNQCKVQSIEANSHTQVVAAIDKLRYLNTSVTTGAMTTIDGDSGTEARKLYFKNAYFKMLARNNYKVAARVKIYLVTSKGEGSSSPQTYFEAGLLDQGNPSNVSVLAQYTDSRLAQQFFKIEKSTERLLQPGQEMTLSYNAGSFYYDPSVLDGHPFAFQKRWKSCFFVIRVQGSVAHDTSLLEYGTTAAAVDTLLTRKFEVVYDAGADLDDFSYATTDLDPPTNFFVQSYPNVEQETFGL